MSQCRSCRADIVWMKTTTGKSMPVDFLECKCADTEGYLSSRGHHPDCPRSIFNGLPDRTFDPKLHTSHFATCPNADQHRRRR